MTRYVLRIAQHVEESVCHLHPHIRRQIRSALDDIQEDPSLGKPLNSPLNGLYSFRVASYRIIYRIRQKEIMIEVVEIAKRDIVYSRVAALLGVLQ